MPTTLEDALDPRLATADPYVAELVFRLRDSGPVPADLARLALRYAELGQREKAVAVFERIDPDDPLRESVRHRLELAARRPRRTRAARLVVPEDGALADAFAFAWRETTLVATALAAVPAMLATLMLGQLLPSTALTFPWFVVTQAALAAILGPLGRSALPRHGTETVRDALARLRQEIAGSARAFGLVSAVMFGPALVVGLVWPLGGGLLALLAFHHFALVLPRLLRDPHPRSLRPGLTASNGRAARDEAFLLLAMGSLVACVAMGGWLLVRMSPLASALATFAYLHVASAAVRLATTSHGRMVLGDPPRGVGPG